MTEQGHFERVPGACPATDPEGWHCSAGAGHHGPHVPLAGQPWTDQPRRSRVEWHELFEHEGCER